MGMSTAREVRQEIFSTGQISVKFSPGFAYSTCSEFSGGESLCVDRDVYAAVDDLIFAEEVNLPSDRY